MAFVHHPKAGGGYPGLVSISCKMGNLGPFGGGISATKVEGGAGIGEGELAKAGVFNYSNLQNQVSLPSSSGHAFYRLVMQSGSGN